MKWARHTCLMLWGAFVFVACGDNEPDDEDAILQLGGTVSTARPIEPGEVCEAGGIFIQTGLDEDADGRLSEDEVSDSFNVCNGVSAEPTDGDNGTPGTPGIQGDAGNDGETTLTRLDAAPLSSCPAGGSLISIGLDTDSDGVLATAEVTSSAAVCNGQAGNSGCAPVVRVTPLTAGVDCPFGGLVIDFGADGDANAGGAGGVGGLVDCDGLLDPSELLSSRKLCNGADGPPGSDGMDGPAGNDGNDGSYTVVRISGVLAGAACPLGGSLLESGSDDDGDGLLDDAEVDRQDIVCVDGSSTQLVLTVPVGGLVNAGATTCTDLIETTAGGISWVDSFGSSLGLPHLVPTEVQVELFGGVACGTTLQLNGVEAAAPPASFTCSCPGGNVVGEVTLSELSTYHSDGTSNELLLSSGTLSLGQNPAWSNDYAEVTITYF